jgi:hypothetical protein
VSIKNWKSYRCVRDYAPGQGLGSVLTRRAANCKERKGIERRMFPMNTEATAGETINSVYSALHFRSTFDETVLKTQDLMRLLTPSATTVSITPLLVQGQYVAIG